MAADFPDGNLPLVVWKLGVLVWVCVQVYVCVWGLLPLVVCCLAGWCVGGLVFGGLVIGVLV